MRRFRIACWLQALISIFADASLLLLVSRDFRFPCSSGSIGLPRNLSASLLQRAVPPSGCDPRVVYLSNIVVARAGGCSVSQKAYIAERAGAQALVLFGRGVSLHSDGDEIGVSMLPVLVVSKKQGAILWGLSSTSNSMPLATRSFSLVHSFAGTTSYFRDMLEFGASLREQMQQLQVMRVRAQEPTEALEMVRPRPFKRYIVCSWGGVRSKMVTTWLQSSTPADVSVYHVHDRFPPANLTHVQGENFMHGGGNKMTKEEQESTRVLFLYRGIGASVASRFSLDHCRNIQGSRCETLLAGSRPLQDYVQKRHDRLNLHAHW